MIIRCERCSTLYELEDGLLGPDGSSVQCTRCEHVFVALPARAAASTTEPCRAEAPRSEPAALAPPPEPVTPSIGSRAPDAPTADPVDRDAAAPAAPPSGPRPPASDRPRAARGSGPAVYHPPSATLGSVVPRAPMLMQNPVGAFERRLRKGARLRWLVPAVALGLVAVTGVTWLALVRRADPEAARMRDEAVALLALDDAASLSRGEEQLAEAARRDPSLEGLAADRVVATVLSAAALAESAEALAGERPGREVDDPEIAGKRSRARALASSALEAVRSLEAQGARDAATVDAVALYHALLGDRAEALRRIDAARADGGEDPWLALAEVSAEVRAIGPGDAGRALARLQRVSAAHPHLLRARYLLARTQATAGRTQEALATLDGLLSANPAHERAQRLKAELRTVRRPSVLPPPVSAVAPPAENAASLPRKPLAHGGAPASAPRAADPSAAASAPVAARAVATSPAADTTPGASGASPAASGMMGTTPRVPAASDAPAPAPTPAAVPIGPALPVPAALDAPMREEPAGG